MGYIEYINVEATLGTYNWWLQGALKRKQNLSISELAERCFPTLP